MDADLIYPDEAYHIIGACFEVYNVLGNGFLESVYQKALEVELRLRRTPFTPQNPIKVFYKGIDIGQTYIPDFVCYGKIILEIKAEAKLSDVGKAQIINYLKATGYRLGLLVNFGHHKTVEWERIVL